MRSPARFTAFLSLALFVLPACDSAESNDATEVSDTSGDEDSGDRAVDASEVQAKLDGFPTGFTKINDARVQTQAHTAAQTVDTWVEDDWVATYLSIDPNASGANPSFDPGATIVKEQFDAEGVRDSMTVMVKAGAGFNPDVGDWWWAFADGSAQVQGSGVLDACVGCHQARPDDDFLFGVPFDNRL